MTVYNLSAAGLVKASQDAINNGTLKIAKFVFDTAEVDSSGASNKTVAAHGTGVTLPDEAIVVGGFFVVGTAFTSAANTAEIAIHVNAANDIQTAAAVSGAPYHQTGKKAIVPKINTPESTSITLTADREITLTVTVQALTAGALEGVLIYIAPDA